MMPFSNSSPNLKRLPKILSNYGNELAGVLVGPYDFSIMAGTPLDIRSEQMVEHICQVFALCKEAGISCGSFVDDASLISHYHNLGANIYWTGTEVSLLCEAYSGVCTAFQQETE